MRTNTPTLLLVTALIEGATGVVLLVAPALVVSLLIGTLLDTASGIVLARVAGSALVSLALVCWAARNEPPSHATRGLVRALLFYNVAVAAVFIHLYVALGLSGIALWPAVGVHAAMAAWCVARVRDLAS